MQNFQLAHLDLKFTEVKCRANQQTVKWGSKKKREFRENSYVFKLKIENEGALKNHKTDLLQVQAENRGDRKRSYVHLEQSRNST